MLVLAPLQIPEKKGIKPNINDLSFWKNYLIYGELDNFIKEPKSEPLRKIPQKRGDSYYSRLCDYSRRKR